jgi:hypothetical protein
MSTSIDTSQNIIYKDLYKVFGELLSIIKKNSISTFKEDGTIRDINNANTIFQAAITYLLPSFEGTLTSGGYSTTDKLPIPAENSTELKILQTTTFNNEFFKNTLSNCFNLNIDQSKYVSEASGVTNAEIEKLVPNGTKIKQHLHYYNKIITESGIGGTKLQFDEAIVKNIYYTIFLLDIYIKIIEAFLTVEFNVNYQNNQSYWDNTRLEVLSNTYVETNPDYNRLVNFSQLASSYDNKKYVKDYTKIHIVTKPLLKQDSVGVARGLFIIEPDNDKYRYAESGLYLYIGNDFEDHSASLRYFDISEMRAASTSRPGSKPANILQQVNNNYTFEDRYGSLADGVSLITGTDKYSYGYKQYNFNDVPGGNFTEDKKPYQKFIRTFLIMLRNIKYSNLNSTLEYLKVFFKGLKKLLLSSIYSINIYYNLAYSLKNCLLLNYPKYKASEDTTTTANKFINYITDSATLTPPSDAEIDKYHFNTDYEKTFVYKVSKSSANFKAVLDKNIELLENNININIGPASNSMHSYVPDENHLIYTSFVYDSLNNSINPYTGESIPASQKTKDKLIRETLETKIRYSILIPHYNILLSIEEVNISNGNNPIILLKEFESILKDKPLEAGSTTKYLHQNIAVYLYENSIYELKNTNDRLKSSIEHIDKNINSNKTKILNNTSLYEVNKSKNTILYYEYVIYIAIIAIILAVIFIINIARIDKSLIRIISAGCFGITILMLAVYYIIHVLFITESYIETFTASAQNTAVYSTSICNNDCIEPGASITGANKVEYDPVILANKKSLVVNRLTDRAKDLINVIKMTFYYTDTQTLFNKENDLNSLISNRYNDKNYVNYFLENKTGDAHLNTDVIKYENANYDVYIFSIILLAIIIVGFYTINLFTNNIYMGVLFLIAIILIICLFTYFIINIVRTVSSNYYWGREFEKTYENFENPLKEDYEEEEEEEEDNPNSNTSKTTPVDTPNTSKTTPVTTPATSVTPATPVTPPVTTPATSVTPATPVTPDTTPVTTPATSVTPATPVTPDTTPDIASRTT